MGREGPVDAWWSGQGDGGRHLVEEVAALVVHHDECREVLHLDPPDGLHAEFWVLEHLDLPDGVQRQPGGRTPDGAQVEASVPGAGLSDLTGPVALGQHHQASAGRLEPLDVGVHAACRGRAERPRCVALRGLGRAGVVDGVVPQVLRHRLAGVQHLRGGVPSSKTGKPKGIAKGS